MATESDVLATAFAAVYEEGAEWSAAADYVRANAPRYHQEFVRSWREAEGEFDYETPDSYMERVRAEDAELDRVSESVRVAMEEREAAAARESGAAMASVLMGLPDGAELMPQIFETTQREIAKDPANSTIANMPDMLAGAYVDAHTRKQVAEDALHHARESQPFASSLRAQAYGAGLGKDKDPYAGLSTPEYAAVREAQMLGHAVDLYNRAVPAEDVLASPQRSMSEAEEQAVATEAFTRKHNAWASGFVKAGAPPVMNEREKNDVARRADEHSRASAVIGRLERNQGDEFRAAQTAGAEFMFPGDTPRELPRHTASTPRAWWLHDD